MRGPPPPPGFGVPAVVLPPGKLKHKPSVPMKQLPWMVIKQEQMKGTLWENIDDTKLNLNFAEIESIFSAKPPTVVSTATSAMA